jgi:hypothetical protein
MPFATRSFRPDDVVPINPRVLAERLAWAAAHPYPPTNTAGPTCARCNSAVYGRIVRLAGVPIVESICTGGHSEYLGRLRSDGYFARAYAQ